MGREGKGENEGRVEQEKGEREDEGRGEREKRRRRGGDLFKI